MNPTNTTETIDGLWRWLGLWKERRWPVYLGGLVCAALSGTPGLTAPPAAAVPSKGWIVRDGPDLVPPTAEPIPTTAGDGPDLFATSASSPGVLPIAAPLLTRDAAVRWALQNNPEIAALRQQHGIAAANIIIAATYPFNPLAQSTVQGINGPVSATLTNRVAVAAQMTLEVEVHGQRGIREQGASATLSRTDNEIAFQELSLAVRTGRAYDTLLYRQEKVRVAEEAVQLTREDVEKVRKLVAAGRLKAVDEITIRTELNDFLAQANMARTALAPAQTELRRALGIVECVDISDTLETPSLALDGKTLHQEALRRRPDRQAKEAAVAEAESHLKLEIANRYGNPSIGPSYSYDNTRDNYIGAQIGFPIPVLNQHTGEIRQREAERDRAVLELRDSEVQIGHDVNGALARLALAREWAEQYRTKILPELRASVEAIETLFNKADPATTGADILRVIDVHRKLLRARDGYLDALWEMRQAQSDLAAALGDPALLAPSLRGLCAAP